MAKGDKTIKAVLESLLAHCKEKITMAEMEQYEWYLQGARLGLNVGREGFLQVTAELETFLERFPEVDALSDDFSAKELKERRSLYERLLPLEQQIEEVVGVIKDVRRQVEHEIVSDLYAAYGAIRGVEKSRLELKTTTPLLHEYMKNNRRRKKAQS